MRIGIGLLAIGAVSFLVFIIALGLSGGGFSFPAVGDPWVMPLIVLTWVSAIWTIVLVPLCALVVLWEWLARN